MHDIVLLHLSITRPVLRVDYIALQLHTVVIKQELLGDDWVLEVEMCSYKSWDAALFLIIMWWLCLRMKHTKQPIIAKHKIQILPRTATIMSGMGCVVSNEVHCWPVRKKKTIKIAVLNVK